MIKRKLVMAVITLGFVFTLIFAVTALSACNTETTLLQQTDALGQKVQYAQNGGNLSVAEIDELFEELVVLRGEVMRFEGDNAALLARIDGYRVQLNALRSGGKNIVRVISDDMIKMINPVFHVAMSSPNGTIQIALNYHNENIVFESSVNQGSLYAIESGLAPLTEHMNANINVASGTTISWVPFELIDDSIVALRIESVFISIIVRNSESIVGFGVVEVFDTSNETLTITAKARLLASYYFPKIDGNFQNVTEQYVRGTITNIINNKGEKLS